jgi:hypothetical protein
MLLIVKQVSTSVRIQVFVADSTVTTGAGKTGLTNASFTAYYFRDGDATATSITLAAGTVGTWSSGGVKEIDATNMPGWYEFGVPNAVFANVVRQASVMLKGAGVVPINVMFQLVPWDPQDTVRLGLTSIPNVAQGTTGQLATGNSTGQVTVATNNDKTGYTASTVSDKTGYSLAAADSYINASGTATAGTASTITLAVGSSAVTNFYVGDLVKITSGTGAGQGRMITAYNGGTRVATIAPNWITNPDSTSVYQVMFDDGSVVTGYAPGQDPATLVLDTVDAVDNATNADTPRKWMRIWNAVLAGISSGQNTTTAVFQNFANSKSRISATVDANGNRTAVGTRDGT